MSDTPTPTADPFIEHFKHRGKTYKIFKRVQTAEAAWYLCYEFRGQRHKISGHTNAKVNAIQFFKTHIESAWSGRLAELKVQKAIVKPGYSTLGELLRGVEQAPLDLDQQTRRQAINCLRNAVRRVKGQSVNVDSLSSDIFNADFVSRFFENAITASQTRPGQEEATRVKRTANSILNQGKSLLRPKVVACLRRNGYVNAQSERVALVLPDYDDFNRAVKEERFEGVHKVTFNPPPDSLVDQTLHRWVKVEDRNRFLALGLELAFGLRKAEVSQAKWSWLTVIEGQPFLDGEAKVKNGGGRVQVRALDPFWTILRRRIAREGWAGQPDAYILSGTETDRCESVFRGIGAWMRELGWATQKTNHAWRAYAGGQVAMRYGIYSAFIWLRHSSVTVTEQHYSHFIAKHKVDSHRKITRRWAKAPRNVLALKAA